tara:strand:+ start:17 stop:472 length:456 start_codon:yes stop_codon:yes gene_type:complete
MRALRAPDAPNLRFGSPLLPALHFSMTDHLTKISRSLTSSDIAHDFYHDCIHIALPNNFGTLEVKAWPEGDDSIGLLEGDFHTHSDVLAKDLGTEPHEAIGSLIQKVLSREYFLIEEREPGKPPRKLIEPSLEQYLKYLPDGADYEIKNEM